MACLQHPVSTYGFGGRFVCEAHAKQFAYPFQPWRPRIVPDRFLTGAWLGTFSLVWHGLHILMSSHQDRELPLSAETSGDPNKSSMRWAASLDCESARNFAPRIASPGNVTRERGLDVS
jgi:hypothetical protein